jgi:hypothetical protein
MNVEISVKIDGREVAHVCAELETSQALALEEQTEQVKNRVGQAVLEVGWAQLVRSLKPPCCCGQKMRNKGKRPIAVNTHNGEVTLQRPRYYCQHCGDWRTPADAVICCGNHRISRLLSRNVCQLATLQHFTHLEELVADQHGVHVGHDRMMQLVHDVGGAAEAKRLAEVEFWEQQPVERRRWPPPEVTPQRVYVSCDGIMYCTNETEPDPQQAGQRRLRWKQMRVGCVYWQDQKERWHKRVIWGQEEDFLSFGASLYRLACRCGYRQAREKIFAADGGDWCWTIHQTYFADASGILDWYHASEHVWACAKTLRNDPEAVKTWADAALARLRHAGGEGLLKWLLAERGAYRGKKHQALTALINYIQPRLDRTDYPTYRAHKWQIGTGMVESTAKQLVGVRLKGPGMRWSRHGATAMTALKAHTINGTWHTFWNNLALAT